MLHPDDEEDAAGAVSFDDSLTSLHWLQNFSIVSAAPDRAPGFAWRPQQLLHQPGGTESPSSPPAGDTASCGTPHTPGNPGASYSKLAGTNVYSALTGQQSHQEVDYKTNPHVKPPYSYATLICMAMQASKKTKITLSAIYSWITDNFCYYRHAEPSWQVWALVQTISFISVKWKEREIYYYLKMLLGCIRNGQMLFSLFLLLGQFYWPQQSRSP